VELRTRPGFENVEKIYWRHPIIWHTIANGPMQFADVLISVRIECERKTVFVRNISIHHLESIPSESQERIQFADVLISVRIE